MADEDNWWTMSRKEASRGNQGGYNFVEITRLPRKIDNRTLTSLIVSAAKIVPVNSDVCLAQNAYGHPTGHVAVVQFKTEQDAAIVIGKLKSTAYGKVWGLKIVKDPKFLEPTSN